VICLIGRRAKAVAQDLTVVKCVGVYDVAVLPEEDEYNYGVLNTETHLVEYSCNSLPQAIYTARSYEQFLQEDGSEPTSGFTPTLVN
jgi:hypothetical protein